MVTSVRRRTLLRMTAGSALTALLAACGDAGTGVNGPEAPKLTEAPNGVATPTPVRASTVTGGTGGQTPAPVVPSAGAAGGTSPTYTANPAVKGSILYWQQTYDDPNSFSAKYHDEWAASLTTALPNVTFKEEQYSYTGYYDKLRTVVRANQPPDAALLTLIGSPEFAASGALAEINLADFGYKPDDFWPGALKSVTWRGKLYGIPTNNETMAFIYNMDLFEKAGLDPNKGPDTWEDVKNFSRQIKEKTGKPGYGLVAILNNGNTPARYMPLCWAYGGAALDETADAPTFQKSGFDSEGNVQALQWLYDVFVRDRSAPASALTNSQTETRNLFIAGEVAMMIDQPSAYTIVKAKAPEIAAKIKYVLYPRGPVRRAVTFGGSNLVMFKGTKNMDAVKAVMKDRTSPYWSIRLAWDTSNPGNRQAFLLPEQQQRLKEIKFLDVTTEMLQYGISWPSIPENSDIMNLYVPQMIQDVLTNAKTSEQAAKDAARKTNDLIAKRT